MAIRSPLGPHWDLFFDWISAGPSLLIARISLRLESSGSSSGGATVFATNLLCPASLTSLLRDQAATRFNIVFHQQQYISGLSLCRIFISPLSIFKLISNYKSKFLGVTDASGVRIFVEHDKEVEFPTFSLETQSQIFREINLVSVPISLYSSSPKAIVDLLLNALSNPEIFTFDLPFASAFDYSPEVFLISLQLKGIGKITRIFHPYFKLPLLYVFEYTQAFFFPKNLKLLTRSELFLEIWLNTWKYIEAYLNEPWILSI